MLLPQYPLEKDIANAPKKIEGIYKSFTEFRTNSPSVKGNLQAAAFHIKLFNDSTRQFENFPEKFWGACIKDTVYIYTNQSVLSQNPKIYPIEVIGRYCYSKAYSSSTDYSQDLLTTSYKFEYIMSINNGQIYKLSKRFMRTLLEKDSDLLNRFEKEKSKSNTFMKYIQEYNTKHAGDIKPIQKSTSPH